MNKSVRNIVIGSLAAAAGLTVFVFVKKASTKKVKIKNEKKVEVEEPQKEKTYHLIHVFEKKDDKPEESKTLEKVM